MSVIGRIALIDQFIDVMKEFHALPPSDPQFTIERKTLYQSLVHLSEEIDSIVKPTSAST